MPAWRRTDSVRQAAVSRRGGAAKADPTWISGSAQRVQIRCGSSLSYGCLYEARHGRQTYELFAWPMRSGVAAAPRSSTDFPKWVPQRAVGGCGACGARVSHHRAHPSAPAPAAADNLCAERLLRDNGTGWTVLCPTQLASNALWRAESVREHPVGPSASCRHRTSHRPPRRHRGGGPRGADRAASPRADVRARLPTGTRAPRQQARAIGTALVREVSVEEVGRVGTSRRTARGAQAVRRVTGSPIRAFGQWAAEHAATLR